MKKIELIKQAVVDDQGSLIKYSTQIDNVYIYEVQLGWGRAANILRMQKDGREDIYGEKSVIVTYHDYNVSYGFFGGVEYIHYTRGLKSKYFVDYSIRKPYC